MLPELQECIEKTKDKLYQGFVETDKTGLPWLDSVCADLHQLLRIVHKYLIFERNGQIGTLEACFLCISQIVTCIRWLERTLTVEQNAAPESKQPQPQSRQCFLERIIWCLERLKTVLESEGPAESVTESNFVTYLDLALNLVCPLTVASEEECSESEYDVKYRAVIVESGRVRSVLEALISQTFGFCNVLPEEDRKRVMICCQKVLRECGALERAASDGTGSSDKKLFASVLEAAIYQLETLVNECLLRLVYDSFGDTDRRLLTELQRILASKPSEEDLEEHTKPFDQFVERLMQIGLFAISYADDLKVSSAIRSTLASIEALDSYLIPLLYLGTGQSTTLLEEHWLEEAANLRKHVNKIIDTSAFASSLIELLDAGIDSLEQQYEPAKGLELVQKAEIFLQHLEQNGTETKLHEDPLHQHYKAYRMMTLECRAIVECTQKDPTIDPGRVVKRFRVLLAKLRKIQSSISNGKGGTKPIVPPVVPQVVLTELTTKKEEPPNDCIEVKESAPPVIEPRDEHENAEETLKELFSTDQVRMSSTNILYRSRRGQPAKRRMEATSLLEINTFTDIINYRRTRADTTPDKGSLRRKTPRRNSLRVAIFKKQQRIEMAAMYDSIKSDIDLQITEILDELTDLSDTFSTAAPAATPPAAKTEVCPSESSKAVDRKSITNEEIAIENDHKIRINIYTEIL
ncbi:serendipity locus protein alpha-like [Anopheles aquasalis]|uniref:serendipity locus protein alpha-like n=1 Tax=Anopheles aquasalis TaxID=42839 RepID=UPI00215B559D|nr:serendipity locus protein alpha-like [Anopheles aquasalis]